MEMRVLWLVEDHFTSCYNHPARGDYNTEEETNKMKENTVALIIILAVIVKQLFFSGSVNIVE